VWQVHETGIAFGDPLQGKLQMHQIRCLSGLPPLPAEAVIVGDPLRRILAELKLPFGFILFSLQHLHNAGIIRCFGKIKNPPARRGD